jgi:hypothetical protein
MPIDAGTAPEQIRTWTRRDSVILAALLVATLLTRLMASYVWWSDASTDPDAYVGIARAIAAGDGFCTPGTKSPTAYRPPLYPLLLSLVMTNEPAVNAAMICALNIFLAILCINVSFLSGRSISTSVGTWAACLLILDPLLNRVTSLPMTETTFTRLTATAVLLLSVDDPLSISKNRWVARFVLHSVGWFLALAALCRPTIWPFIGLYTIGLLFVHRRQWREVVVPLAAMWLAILVVVSPWVIRNQLVLGSPILTTTHGGYTLLLGNNPVFYDEVARKPWGTVWDGASLERWQHAMLAEMDADLGPNADEVAADRWQAAKAWGHIQADPAGFGWAVWYRVRSLWSLAPRGPKGEALPVAVRWLVAGWYATLFGLAIAGAVIWYRDHRPGLWVLLLFIASIQGMHLIYWTDTRMRAPLHPVLALLAAVAVDRGWRAWRRTAMVD